MESNASLDMGDKGNGCSGEAICDLIFSTLRVLLLRAHAYHKARRLGLHSRTVGPPIGQSVAGSKGQAMDVPPVILRPIVEVLQYHVFCSRIESELQAGAAGLRSIGVPVSVRFNSTSDNGRQTLDAIVGDAQAKLEGEAVLRIDNR